MGLFLILTSFLTSFLLDDPGVGGGPDQAARAVAALGLAALALVGAHRPREGPNHRAADRLDLAPGRVDGGASLMNTESISACVLGLGAGSVKRFRVRSGQRAVALGLGKFVHIEA